MEEEGAERPHEEDEEEPPLAAARAVVGAGCPLSRVASVGSHSDSSDKDPCAQDSSNDADSEASESEWTPRPASKYCRAGPAPTTPSSPSPPSLKPSPTGSIPLPRPGGAVEQLVSAVSKMNLGPSFPGDGSPAARFPAEDAAEKAAPQARDNLHHQQQQQQQHPLPQGAFQALSHSYTPSSKECSVQSCLHQFTSVELLMGNNKLLCESCTERRQKTLRKSGSAGRSDERYFLGQSRALKENQTPWHYLYWFALQRTPSTG